MVASRVFRILLCLTFAFVSLSLFAQQTGTISGRVTDSSGAALPGVTVEAVSNVAPQPRVTVSGDNGDYRLPALQPGTYTVTYTLAGLQDARRRVSVVIDQTSTVDVSLGIAAQSEVITVTAEATLVDRSSATLGAGLSNEQILALPISQEYKDLQKLIPGVMVSQDLNRGPSAGGSGQDNVYLFDGVNVTMPLFGIMTTEPATHDVAQFSVVKGGARAVDFERSGGFTVDSVSKSGTNEFAGELSYQVLDSSFIADLDNATNLKYEQDRSWATANIGGPILRDALYFYGSYYRPVYKRDNQANLYGELPPYKLERNEYFGKLTYAPTQELLFNGSYRSSKRDETNDQFGTRQAASTGFGYETELKIGTFEGSWIPNSKMYGTFKYTDFRNPGGGKPDNFADVVPSFTAGSRLDINNLSSLGLLTVPTRIATNPTQSAFVGPYIDRYGYIQNGVATGGGTVGFARYAADDDSFYRKAGQVAFNYALVAKGLDHDFHIGYQRSIDEEDRFQLANGWGSITIPGGTVNCPANACGSAKPAFFQANLSQQSAREVPAIHSEFHSQNIELNDTIRKNNWTFNIGVLLSNDTLYGQGLKEADNIAGFVASAGSKYKMHETEWEEMMQPRLSATWAYNGSDTLFASYARYHPAANSDARAASWDRNLVRDINAYFDADGVLMGIDPVAASSGKLFADSLDPRTVTEYMVGTGQQLATGWSSRVYGRYRYGNNFWEDTNNDARIRFGANVPGVRPLLYIPNLGQAPNASNPTGSGLLGAIGSGSTYVIAELDGAFTKYYEATLETDYNKGPMFVRGSYTWSHYYGNFDQDNTSFNSANDAAIFIGSSNIGDGAGRQLWDNKYGDLRGDRRHILKVYGTYTLPWNATAGAFGLYQSGQPYQLESFLPYTGLTTSTSDTNRYAEPAGRRKSPAHHQVDLNYTQNIGLPRNLNLQLIVDIFNLYDKQTGYNYETRVGTLGTCDPTKTTCAFETGLGGALAYLAQAPYAKSFYEPRRIQFRAKLQF
ncbi:MAG TPA: carboxypeptidase-like regulatory domain-containing protein [Thermoanaerobaculia bacterium]|nr:carboxypeptidase-like regulatory domain-containing protein [Thermoanaerobaculia bacterium]